MVDAMAKDGAARLRLRPVGAADRKKLPEYGPLGTGCPAIERAVAALYKGQNEESFWALMNAINRAKPAAAKGIYLRSVVLSSTMGPGIKVNPLKF